MNVAEWVGWTGAVGVLVLAPSPRIVFADSNEQVQAANKTATAAVKATAEVANACAQSALRGSPCTPLPTVTLSPTSTPVPALPTVAPTAVPLPSDTSTPAPPSLPVPAIGGNPIGGYLRPSAASDPNLLELALREGRWDIALGQDACGGLLAPWSNVWMLRPEDSRVALAGDAYFAALDETLLCSISSAVRRSDAPCAQDEDGRCDVEMDGGFWEAVAAQQAVAPTGTPTDIPISPTPIVVTRVIQVPAPPPQVVYQQADTPQPIVITVVSTVLVPAATPTPVPSATRTVVPSPAPTWTAVPTIEILPEPTAQPLAAAQRPEQASSNLGGWGLALLGLGAIGTMVWRGRRRGGDE